MRFLLDVSLHPDLAGALRRRGVDVIHAADEGLARATDQALLHHASRTGRVLVTWNHRDFGPLTEAYVRLGRSFPGVLFVSQGLRRADPGVVAKALTRWMKTHPSSGNAIADGYGWLGES